MSGDQPAAYYPSQPTAANAGPHPTNMPFYYSAPIMEPQLSGQPRNAALYQQRFPAPPYYNTPGTYTMMVPNHFIPTFPGQNNSRPQLNTPSYMSIPRPQMDNYSPHISYQQFSNNTMQPGYPQMIQNYAGTSSYVPAQAVNNSTPQPPSFVMPTTINAMPQQTTVPQMTQPMPTVQHQLVDPSLMQPTSVPNTQQAINYSQNTANSKRPKKPLAIVDPVSNKQLVVDSISTATTSTTVPNESRPTETNKIDSNVSNHKSNDDVNKVQAQADFRRQFAMQIREPSSTQTDKSATASKVGHDDSSSAISSKSQTETAGSRSGSISRPKSPTPTPTITAIVSVEDKIIEKKNDVPVRKPSVSQEEISTTTNNEESKETRDRSNSQKQSNEPVEKQETERTSTSDDVISKRPVEQGKEPSRPTPLLSSSQSLECVTPPQTPTAFLAKSDGNMSTNQGPAQRLRYDRDELIRIRDSSNSLPIPDNLPDLDIIINRRDLSRFSYPNYMGANSHGRLNPSYNRQQSGGNHPSLTRFPNASNHGSHDARRKQAIYISAEPDFEHRVEDPYKRVDQSKIDANNRFLREVKAILNKVTPQTYEKLQKQLQGLVIDRYERLEGMINIFFSKAVDEPAFSFLYAKLCKQFQKQQVTVVGDDGRTVTYFFRQILLTKCQKEFENDYRQEIEYEKRMKEVEAITDEKKHKEEDEKLQEDLLKAKRRKLGNIFFIGELFKLQMLTDTIMYDCIEYLLRDKTDEESLECLCRLLRTIGKELDAKASEKLTNKTNLEKHYRELDQIIREQRTSARIRFMIQDLIELRQASWVARRAETKPLTIDEIHEQVRQNRIQQEREQERERQQRREQNRNAPQGGNYTGNNQQQYSDGRGSRGSGMKNQTSRNEDDRVENRFNVNTLRQLQSNDRRNQGPMTMNLAPQRTWARGSGIEKKPEEDNSSAAAPRSGKPPTGPVQQWKGKSGSSQGNSNNPVQRQSSRELARENSYRDRENALQSLRKTTGGSGFYSPGHGTGGSSINNSREGSRNVSREQSRNTSRESSLSERASNASLTARTSKTSALDASTIINPDPSETTFDEEKILARVHSLIEEYTENYSDASERPVKEALEDLLGFRTGNLDQQAIIVRELFYNVFEAKSRARKAVGHLLDAAINDEIILADAFDSGFKMIVESVPDFAVDIPLIWQYIGEIIGAFIGAPSNNFHLLKPILSKVPTDKTKQLFEYIIHYATEFSSQAHLQKLYQLSGLTLDELIDSSIEEEFQWLTKTDLIVQSKDNLSPRADPQLVKLFKSCNEQSSLVTDPDILNYIHQHMDPNGKFYIRNIVLSYLEACLINRDPLKKIQEDTAKKRMTVLNTIIQHKPEAEIQAVYAIQNFVDKLEHPPKMARLLFDIFYDEECVSEDAFFDWLKKPDPSETEGHAVVEISTKDFFTWLQQAETEVEEGEEEAN